MRSSLCVGLILLCVVVGFAQKPVPRDKTTAAIDGKRITIEYGRPVLKGRSFDELLKQLPADRMWRMGANEVTLLSTDAPLAIGGKQIPAGKYSLYMHCPESGEYSLAINKDLGQPLSKVWSAAPAAQANLPYPHFEYQAEIGNLEVARIPMKKGDAPETETFTINLTPSGSGATMTVLWGGRSWTLEIAAAR